MHLQSDERPARGLGLRQQHAAVEGVEPGAAPPPAGKQQRKHQQRQAQAGRDSDGANSKDDRRDGNG